MSGPRELNRERTVRMRNRFYKELQRGQQSPNQNIFKSWALSHSYKGEIKVLSNTHKKMIRKLEGKGTNIDKHLL